MDGKELKESDQNIELDRGFKIPKSIAFLEPPIKVSLVEKEKHFNLSKKKQLIAFYSQLLGLIFSLFFAGKSVQLAADNEKQDSIIHSLHTMIKKYDTVIDRIEITNLKIDRTNNELVSLLKASLIQDENFRKAYNPKIILKSPGYFSSAPGPNNNGGNCESYFVHGLKNIGGSAAMNFSVRILYFDQNSDTLRYFHSYSHGIGSNFDFAKNDSIEFNYIDNPIYFPCDDMNALFRAPVIMELKYLETFTLDPIVKTEYWIHKRNGDTFYFEKPSEMEEAKMKKWRQKNPLYFKL